MYTNAPMPHDCDINSSLKKAAISTCSIECLCNCTLIELTAKLAESKTRLNVVQSYSCALHYKSCNFPTGVHDEVKNSPYFMHTCKYQYMCMCVHLHIIFQVEPTGTCYVYMISIYTAVCVSFPENKTRGTSLGDFQYR